MGRGSAQGYPHGSRDPGRMRAGLVSFWQGDVKREPPWESITYLNCSQVPHMHWSCENNSGFRERRLCITVAAVCGGVGEAGSR